MPIDTTGNDRIDTAAAEIAVAIRDARVGLPTRYRDQDHYNEAQRLRDEIIMGTLASCGQLPPWVPGVNGTSERPWFVVRGHGTDSDLVPLRQRYYEGPDRRLHRYGSMEAAQSVADQLNEAERGS